MTAPRRDELADAGVVPQRCHGGRLAGDDADGFLRVAAARLGGAQVEAVRERAEAVGVGSLVAGLAA